MEQEHAQKQECRMGESDAEGNTNLCCCYIMDDNGNYLDPCYQPAEECCCW
jgi:hypothetical protein